MSQPAPQWDPTHQRWYTPIYNPTTETWDSQWLPPNWRPPSQLPPTPQSASHNRQRNEFATGPLSPLAGLPYSPASAASASPSLPPNQGSYDHLFSRPLSLQAYQPTQLTPIPQSSSHAFFTPAAPTGYAQSHYATPHNPPQTGFHRRSSSSSRGHRFPRGEGKRIEGTYSGPSTLHYEPVDPSHYVRDASFFCEGRVLAVMWNETAGSTALDYNTSKSINPVRFADNLVYTDRRRFVVVRKKHEFSYACPIFTYSGRATTKKGVRPEEHSIVYSVGRQPRLVGGESGITKDSIGVVMADGEPALEEASRIYFGIHHPIQFNVKVKDIGRVRTEDMPKLIGYWKEEEDRDDSSKQAPEVAHYAEVSEEALQQLHGADEADEFTYNPSTNIAGYDAKINPHSYHPTHNPYGYHHTKAPFCYHEKFNPYGYHSSLNTNGYHPDSNPYGFHPEKARHCYHERMNLYGYHTKHNPHGYHPDSNPYGFHPTETPFCYHEQYNPWGYHAQHNICGHHPQSNPHGYHPQYNKHGYHPQFNPQAYHPKWQPQGVWVPNSDDNAVDQLSNSLRDMRT